MKKSNSLYDKIALLSKERTLVSSISYLLEWDQETYMPEQGIEWRALQLEFLTSLAHKKAINPQFGKLLTQAIDLQTGSIKDFSLSEAQQSALRAWRLDYNKAKKIPTSFAKAFSRLTSKAMHIWREAKEKNDFNLFAPYLEKIVSLCRKKADLLGYQDHPYDALLDLFEPEMTVKELTPLFSRLEKRLTTLVSKLKDSYHPDTSVLETPVPFSDQQALFHRVLNHMGLKKSFSRLDQSAHPFCMGVYPKDIRLTFHPHASRFTNPLYAVLHEGGHALYDHHLPLEHFGTPLAETISLGIHESQSRFWETFIGHSKGFCSFLFHQIKEFCPQSSAELLYQAINKVIPSLIRIQADEVTYSLHIILRFEMEKALIEGSLKVKDVPARWNELIQKYFHLKVPSDAEGCLQDIHWSMGVFGYFPDYALGNLYGAHFFSAMKKAVPDWESCLEKGDFSKIREWLRVSIHQHGRRYTSKELLYNLTQESLSEEPYLHYLEKKYGALINH